VQSHIWLTASSNLGEKFAHTLIYSETLLHIWLCIRSHLSSIIYEENFVFFLSVYFSIQVQYQSGTRRSYSNVVWTERLSPNLEDMSSNSLCGQEPGTSDNIPMGSKDQMTQLSFFWYLLRHTDFLFLNCLLRVTYIFSLGKWSSPRFTIGDNHCNRYRYSWRMAVLKIGMQLLWWSENNNFGFSPCKKIFKSLCFTTENDQYYGLIPHMYSGRTKYSAFVSKLNNLSEEYLSPQKT
jgi:hypothetical protein